MSNKGLSIGVNCSGWNKEHAPREKRQTGQAGLNSVAHSKFGRPGCKAVTFRPLIEGRGMFVNRKRTTCVHILEPMVKVRMSSGLGLEQVTSEAIVRK